MRQDYAAAKEAGLNVHLDGARLFNAATALGVNAAELAACADSVTFCLSKGLCAPVGSMLCGTKEFIACARRNRKRIGGGLRQAGFLAAAGLIAMNQMSLRLARITPMRKHWRRCWRSWTGVAVAKDQLDINMVFLTLNGLAAPERFCRSIKGTGILINGADHGVYRLVTHWELRPRICRIAAAIDRCRKEL